MVDLFSSLPDPLKRRLDRIGRAIVSGKEAIERMDFVQARNILTGVFQELWKLMTGFDAGEFRHLSKKDHGDLLVMVQDMGLDLETLLKQIPHDALPRTASDYSLVDVEARHREDPESFLIPSEQKRRNLSRGDVVKLIFKSAGGEGERMWVQVEEVFGRGRYEGKLKSTPVVIASLDYDSPVKFEAQNVADIHQQGPMN